MEFMYLLEVIYSRYPNNIELTIGVYSSYKKAVKAKEEVSRWLDLNCIINFEFTVTLIPALDHVLTEEEVGYLLG